MNDESLKMLYLFTITSPNHMLRIAAANIDHALAYYYGRTQDNAIEVSVTSDGLIFIGTEDLEVTK